MPLWGLSEPGGSDIFSTNAAGFLPRHGQCLIAYDLMASMPGCRHPVDGRSAELWLIQTRQETVLL